MRSGQGHQLHLGVLLKAWIEGQGDNGSDGVGVWGGVAMESCAYKDKVTTDSFRAFEVGGHPLGGMGAGRGATPGDKELGELPEVGQRGEGRSECRANCKLQMFPGGKEAGGA